MIPLKIKLTKLNDNTIAFQILQQDNFLCEGGDIFTASNGVNFQSYAYPAIHHEWEEKGNKIIYLRGGFYSQDNKVLEYTFSSSSALSTFVSELTIAVNEFNAYIA